MYCGIMLRGDTETACGIAFITDDEVTTASTTEDDEILALLEEYRPIVITLNAPSEREDIDGFREGEEDLIEDGFSMLPQEMRDRGVLERAEFLTERIKRSGVGARVIESDPHVVMDQLDIAGDADLKDYGYDTGPIESATEFEAVVLALTAKLYDEDHYEEKGLIIPKEL